MQTNKIHNKLSMKQTKKRKEKLHRVLSKINSIFHFFLIIMIYLIKINMLTHTHIYTKNNNRKYSSNKDKKEN